MCLNGGSIAAFPYATQLWQLVAASILTGFAIGIIDPMLNVGCVRLWPPERSGPLMQVFATTFGALASESAWGASLERPFSRKNQKRGSHFPRQKEKT